MIKTTRIPKPSVKSLIVKVPSARIARLIQNLCLTKKHSGIALLNPIRKNCITKSYWNGELKRGDLHYIKIVVSRGVIADLIFTGPKYFEGKSPVTMGEFLLAILTLKDKKK